MFYVWGNAPITSTQTEQTNPSSVTLLAEVSSLGAQTYEARVLCGASTLATFLVEQIAPDSTSLSTQTGALGRVTIYTPTNQTAQYVLRLRAVTGDRVRVRLGTAITGTAAATVQLEALT